MRACLILLLVVPASPIACDSPGGGKGSTADTADTGDGVGDTSGADTSGADAQDTGGDGLETCDPARVDPPAAGCDDGLVPVEIYCEDAAHEVGTIWVCDPIGQEGDICKDGNHYVRRPCDANLTCVSELYESHCRPSVLASCDHGDDCAGGDRCFGRTDGGSLVCAPAHSQFQECTSFDGDSPPGASAADIQGSCTDTLACMNPDFTGDFAFCLPTTCTTATDCGVFPYAGWTGLDCISAEDAGPGRVAGCAFIAKIGERCADGVTPHNGMACETGSLCGPAEGDGARTCVAE